MKRRLFLASVLLAFAFPAHAQDAMKKDAADKLAEPEVKVVLDSWNEIGNADDCGSPKVKLPCRHTRRCWRRSLAAS